MDHLWKGLRPFPLLKLSLAGLHYRQAQQNTFLPGSHNALRGDRWNLHFAWPERSSELAAWCCAFQCNH